MKRIVTLLMSLALLAVVVLPSAAFAASSTCQSYNAQLCQVASNTASRTTGVTTSTAGTLPFTGLDVGLLVVGGGALLGAGLVVRRFSRGVQ
jgi:ABC-type amino acid transport substrate-binding protein